MEDINAVLKQLTIPEKAALLEGYRCWMTNAVPRLGVPSVYLNDGPIGVRRKSSRGGMMEPERPQPATAFPAPVSVANSWSPENARAVGEAIGRECTSCGVDVLLGPAMNLKRDPRCGRNFEYYSEDPLLAGKLAAAFTAGVQSTGTAACPKHFALNNSENFRYMGDSVADERAVRELYLKAFEICVRESRPRTMMCSYNKVNGVHASENRWLLTDVLRNEWGFDGLVMSDWGAVRDRVEGVKAGLDLDMPGGLLANRRAIVRAAESGELPMEALDRSVARVLKLAADAAKRENSKEDMEELLRRNDALAAELAADCAVLLKNENILPLRKGVRVLAVGDLFEKMRYQGAGSSGVCPRYLTGPRDAFDRAGTDYRFARGYRENTQQVDRALEDEAVKAASDAEVVLFFGGLTELVESEGFDRADLELSPNQLSLIDRLCRTGKPVAVILFGGGPMELPFADSVGGILNMFLPGQNGGEACRRLLYGEVNPCGKLSETWMKTVGDIPWGEKFGQKKIEQYRENIFVGYRYFDRAPEKIRYPFGYGLSYTTFDYRDLTIEQAAGVIRAGLTVVNTGGRDGVEIVQLYAGKNAGTAVFKAEKELKAFARVWLKAGESKRVTLSFAEEDLAYYHTKLHREIVENGEYPVLVGASSRDIRLTGIVTVTGRPPVAAPYRSEVVAAYEKIGRCPVTDAVFEETIGRSVPEEPPLRPFTLESCICDFRESLTGRLVYGALRRGLSLGEWKYRRMPAGPERDAALRNRHFVRNLVLRNCPRSLVQSGGGGPVQMKLAQFMTELANGHIGKAIGWLLRPEK